MRKSFSKKKFFFGQKIEYLCVVVLCVKSDQEIGNVRGFFFFMGYVSIFAGIRIHEKLRGYHKKIENVGGRKTGKTSILL